MNSKEIFPVTVMGYLLLIGIFFLIASTIGIPFFTAKTPGKYYLTAISISFILLTGYFFVLWQRGRLKKKGITVVDIRKETIEKMKDETFLAKIATDENEYFEVRERAAKRLQEIRTRSVVLRPSNLCAENYSC
jgi:hypothetical protein